MKQKNLVGASALWIQACLIPLCHAVLADEAGPSGQPEIEIWLGNSQVQRPRLRPTNPPALIRAAEADSPGDKASTSVAQYQDRATPGMEKGAANAVGEGVQDAAPCLPLEALNAAPHGLTPLAPSSTPPLPQLMPSQDVQFPAMDWQSIIEARRLLSESLELAQQASKLLEGLDTPGRPLALMSAEFETCVPGQPASDLPARLSHDLPTAVLTPQRPPGTEPAIHERIGTVPEQRPLGPLAPPRGGPPQKSSDHMRNASLLSLPQPGLRDLLVLVGTLIAALVAIQVGCGSQARWRKQADAAKGSGSSQRETEGAGEGPAVEKTATSEALQQGLLVAAIARNVHLREGLRGK